MEVFLVLMVAFGLAFLFIGLLSWFVVGVDDVIFYRKSIKSWWKRQLYTFFEAGPFVFPVLGIRWFFLKITDVIEKVKRWCLK